MSLRVRGCSVPGDSHLAAGHGCEDALRWADGPHATTLMAIADGLSTASHGATGAALATDALLAEATSMLEVGVPASGPEWHAVLDAILEATRRRVRAGLAAFLPGLGPSAGGATVGLAILAPPWAACAAVGDCFALVQRTDGSLHVLLRPWEGRDAVTVTETLLSAGRGGTRRAVVNDPALHAVALSTDGLASTAIEHAGSPDEYVHEPFVAPLLEHIATDADPNGLASHLLSASDVRARTGDDRTFLVAVTA